MLGEPEEEQQGRGAAVEEVGGGAGGRQRGGPRAEDAGPCTEVIVRTVVFALS